METITEFTKLLMSKGQLKECPLCKGYFLPRDPARLICYSQDCEKRYRLAGYELEREEREKAKEEKRKPEHIEPIIESRSHQLHPRKAIYKERKYYVYLMRSDNGLYKIGRAHNVTNRLKGLNREIPIKVEVIHSVACRDYIAAEKKLHSRFAAKRIKYEWFALDDEDVKWFMNLHSDDIDNLLGAIQNDQY